MSIEIQRYQEDWTLREFLNANLAEEKRIYQTMLQKGILPGDEFLFPKDIYQLDMNLIKKKQLKKSRKLIESSNNKLLSIASMGR